MKNESENIKRIQRVSGTFQLKFTVLLVSIPVATLMYWSFFNYLPAGFSDELPVVVNRELSLKTLVLAFLVSLIPVFVAIYEIINLNTLFKLYENAIVFSDQNTKCFRRLGIP
jgi:hypothetical protein